MIRKPKSERKKLVEKLDRVFSLYIRARDGKCIVCGTTEGLTNGHLFSRIAYSTRWDETNCYAQCYGCNMYHEIDAYPMTEKVRQLIGSSALDDLHRKYRTTQKFKNWDLEALIDKYSDTQSSTDSAPQFEAA